MSDEIAFSRNELELIPAFSPDDLKLIADELDRLYAFQDRQLTSDKKAILVGALSEARLPLRAIIQAIQEMMTVELERIKLPQIIAKAREISRRGVANATSCTSCRSDGLILMQDDQKYWQSLACNCSAGDRWRRDGLASWNGENTQVRKGRILRLQ